MPDSNRTEKEQVKYIIKRFVHIKAYWTALMSLVTLVMVLWFLKINGRIDEGADVIWLLMHVIALYLVGRWSEKKFAQLLSSGERELLARFPKQSSGVTETQQLEKLIRLCKISPQTEYLRPSQQTQDDTLLRPAVSTDTPQDQLLRPAQTDEQ